MRCSRCGKSFDSTSDATERGMMCPACRITLANRYKPTSPDTFVVERIEGNMVVCEDFEGHFQFFERRNFSEGLSEGDIVRKTIITVFEELKPDSSEAKKSAQERLEKLFNRNK